MSSPTVIKCLTGIFCTFGFPLGIRTDGPRIFGLEEIKWWGRRCEIELEGISAYYTPSNGKSERYVGITKVLIKKAAAAGECLQESLALWLATPRSVDGCSLAHILFSWEPHILGLASMKDLKYPWMSGGNELLHKERMKSERNKSTRLNLAPLNMESGLRVLLQCPKSNFFLSQGKSFLFVHLGGHLYGLRGLQGFS